MRTDEVIGAEVSVGNFTAAVAVHMPAGVLAERVGKVLGGLRGTKRHSSASVISVTRAASAWSVAAPRVGTHRCEVEYDLPSLVEWVVVEELRSLLESVTHLHAVAALVDGRAVVAVGPSGAGKSSLALAWSRLGFPIYGDDVVLLDATGQLHAFPRLGKVETALAVAHGLDPARTVDWAPGATEVWVDPVQHGGWAVPAAPALVVRAQWQGGSNVIISPIAPTALLAELPQHVMSPPTTAFWDTLSHLVSGETCTMTFTDARAAAAALVARMR
ncbi:MAG: hypothetical protein WD934_08160 [Gemmatimonadales bacterium]